MSGKEFLTVAKATIREFGKDDVAYLAAAQTYYAFFSLFPLLILSITLIGVFLGTDSEAARNTIQLVFDKAREFLPGSVELLTEVIQEAFEKRSNAGWIALIGVATLAFTASGAFDALDKGINRAWGSEKATNFLVSKLISFAMMAVVAAMLIFSFILTTVLAGARTITTTLVGELYGDQVFWQVLSFLASLWIVFLMLLLMYRFIPRGKVSMRDVWPGALLAAIAWTLVKEGFAYYLGSSFVTYDAVYGPLSTVVALLTWIYISSIIILTGAEFSSETARVRSLRLNTAIAQEKLDPRKPSPWLPTHET